MTRGLIAIGFRSRRAYVCPAPGQSTSVLRVVPYGITGSTALVAVAYQGQTSAGFSVPIVAAAPGIFTADSTSKGQAAAVNQDGTLNSAANPAHPRDVITLFATGDGATSAANPRDTSRDRLWRWPQLQ